MSKEPFNFVAVIPDNTAAIANFESVSDSIRQQPLRNDHHPAFCRFDLPTVSPPDVPVGSPISFSSTATTEIAPSNEGESSAARGCYVLGSMSIHRPVQARNGWTVGSGDWDRDPRTGLVDLLLATGLGISPRHVNFRFDKHGRLALHARHGGVELDGNEVKPGFSRLLSHSNALKIGHLKYRFIHTIPIDEESAFQAVKIKFMEETATTVVDAASNVQTSEAVAVKRLRRLDAASAQKASHEVAIYEALRCIKNHQYGRLVMRMHSVLYKHDEDWNGAADEVFLLWDPLGSATFQKLSFNAAESQTSTEARLSLFCQVCLGIQAVHETGWIHRDIKPPNLYIVRLTPPRAVVGDFGSAVKISEGGHTPRPGSCGTIGWLAPELENPSFAPKYTQAVDVWSLGAVGYYLFVSDRSPCVSRLRHNTFIHMNDPAWEAYTVLMGSLSSSRPESLKGLLYQMLRPYPSRRIALRGVLAHPALQDIMCSLQDMDGSNAPTGSKRSAK
ncbi:MAG: hypothetical protein Q9170_002570 [Blastenia crenularia]